MGPKGTRFCAAADAGELQSAFTAAEGWGTYSQKSEGGKQKVEIEVKWGQLRLKTLSIVPEATLVSPRVTVTANGQPLDAKLTMVEGRAVVTFAEEVMVLVVENWN